MSVPIPPESKLWIFPQLTRSKRCAPVVAEANALVRSLPRVFSRIKRGDVISGAYYDATGAFTYVVWGGSEQGAVEMFDSPLHGDADSLVPLEFLTNDLGSSTFFSKVIRGRERFGWFQARDYYMTIGKEDRLIVLGKLGILTRGERFVPVEFRKYPGGPIEWLLKVSVSYESDPIELAFDWIGKHVLSGNTFVHSFPTMDNVRLKNEPPLWRTLLMEITEEHYIEPIYSFPLSKTLRVGRDETTKQ